MEYPNPSSDASQDISVKSEFDGLSNSQWRLVACECGETRIREPPVQMTINAHSARLGAVWVECSKFVVKGEGGDDDDKASDLPDLISRIIILSRSDLDQTFKFR